MNKKMKCNQFRHPIASAVVFGLFVAGSVLVPVRRAEGQYIGMTVVGRDEGVDGGVTFHTHNQRVVENGQGIFLTHGLQDRPQIRLQRSTDGGRTFATVYSQDISANAPALETDEDDNLYLTFPDPENRRTRFLKFTPGNYASPAVNKSTSVAYSDGKFTSFYDKSRGRIYHGTQYGWFLAFDKSGNLVKSKQVFTNGAQYPHLFVDENGVIHYAHTTVTGPVTYDTIRYLKSTDGGGIWKKMDGTVVSTPVSCDPGDSNSTLINPPDEVGVLSTWLGNMHVKNGKVHFAYNAKNPENGRQVRQHYMRFDATTGVREIDSYTDWNNRWGGASLHIYAVCTFFFSDPDDPDSPLFAAGGMGSPTAFKDVSRLVAVVRCDNGSTWQE